MIASAADVGDIPGPFPVTSNRGGRPRIEQEIQPHVTVRYEHRQMDWIYETGGPRFATESLVEARGLDV